MGEHLEVERKYEVPEGFSVMAVTLPGLRLGEPEHEDLRATYYDTADLVLCRAGVTLRRRTGGHDAGWHVKLPAGGDGRRELRFPLGRSAASPPPTVLAPVLGLVRLAPVSPVARIRTRRTASQLLDGAGLVIAEIADDHVTGTALPGGGQGVPLVTSWRELEVELVDGDIGVLDLVADPLTALGAVRSTGPSKLALVLHSRLAGARAHAPQRVGAGPVWDYLSAQVDELQQADLLARMGGDEGVHRFRVACRRLRSAMGAYRSVVPRTASDPLRGDLQWVGGELSPARDHEVAVEHLRKLLAAQPPELVVGPIAERFAATDRSDLEVVQQQVQKTLCSTRYFAMRDGLDKLLVDASPGAVAPEEVHDVLTKALKAARRRQRHTVRAARAAAPGVERDAAVHEVRKAAKRLRYIAEVAEPALGRVASDLGAAGKQIQIHLGQRQDTVVTREVCRTLAQAAEAADESTFTYGRLHALEEARGLAAEKAFWSLWDSLEL